MGFIRLEIILACSSVMLNGSTVEWQGSSQHGKHVHTAVAVAERKARKENGIKGKGRAQLIRHLASKSIRQTFVLCSGWLQVINTPYPRSAGQ